MGMNSASPFLWLGMPGGSGGLGSSAARTPASASGAPHDALQASQTKRQAWLKEMERAQMAGWFVPSPTVRQLQRSQEGALRTQVMASSHSSAGSWRSAERSPAALATGLAYPPSVPSSFSPHGENRTAALHLNVPKLERDTAVSAQHMAPNSQTTQANAMNGGESAYLGKDSRGAQRLAMTPIKPGVAPLGGEGVVPRTQASPSSPQESLQTPLPPRSLPVMPDVLRPTVFALTTSPASTASAAALGILEATAPLRSGKTQASDGTGGGGYAYSSATRVHAQWSADGLTLWLGVDGSAQQVELQAHAIVHALQKTLILQGQRLSRVVCNGQLVFDAKSGERRAGAPWDFSSFLGCEHRATTQCPEAIPSRVSNFLQEER